MFKEHQLRQDWSQELPRYYFDGSPFKTHLLNALSVTFPHGERFFIDSVKYYKDRITDPTQLEAISVFVKQENWHRYAHQQYNTWLTKIGLPAEHLESLALKKIEWTKTTIGSRGQLLVTVSMEHITAMFAEWILKNPDILKSMHPHFQDLWRWHSIEELEHKSVAMDTLNVIGGGRKRKAMLLTTVNFIYDIARNTVVLLKADGQLWRWRTVKDAVSLLFNFKNGLITSLVAPWFDFMRKNFHPQDHSSELLLANYRKPA